MKRLRVATIIGTRPEIIKMAPVLDELKKYRQIRLQNILTAQHRHMLDQMLDVFSIHIHFDLNIMKHNQSLLDIVTRVIDKMSPIVKKLCPDIILVQGDTTTAFISSLVAFYNKIPVGHIEAGLRTYDKSNPYPEEVNRKLISSLADLHFAPTAAAKNNLAAEGIKRNVYVTGNTVIDSLFMIADRNRKRNISPGSICSGIDFKKEKVILVTAHRRENWGKPIRDICYAIEDLVSSYSDIVVIYPVHLNPNIKEVVYKMLRKNHRVFLTHPLSYEQLVVLMDNCYLVLTDSGGIQEEAPSLGKPVLVLRKVTERPEAVKAGTVKVIGTDRKRIFNEVSKLLNDSKEYLSMSRAVNPYGDGKAAERIAAILLYHFGLRSKLPSEFMSRKINHQTL